LSALALLAGSCTEDNPLSDAQKTAALRKVSVSADSVSYALALPEGATSGKSFEELAAEDSATYRNPANYGITFSQNLTADNTAEGAEDAKFDGVSITMVFDTISSAPLETTAEGFEVPANATKKVTAQGSINLADHRPAGLYVFRRIVDGDPLATTMAPSLRYDIGSREGSIDLPPISQDIPTRASPETKAFLAGLLSSGMFEE
jgi:hypothetical protein